MGLPVVVYLRRNPGKYQIKMSSESPHVQSESGEESPKKKRKVLIAMDESENAAYAFQWYVSNIHREGDTVIVTHVSEYKGLIHAPVMMTDPTLISRMVMEEENRIKLFLAKLTEMLKVSKISGKIVRLTGGSPGEMIVHTAKKEGVDLIFTGTRGLGTVRRTFLGSVSDYVLHHSHVPVFICKRKEH